MATNSTGFLCLVVYIKVNACSIDVMVSIFIARFMGATNDSDFVQAIDRYAFPTDEMLTRGRGEARKKLLKPKMTGINHIHI